MKTKLLKKFRKEADRRVTIKYLERDGLIGMEVRWQKNRARFFPAGQKEEAYAFHKTKYMECMNRLAEWYDWHLKNPVFTH